MDGAFQQIYELGRRQFPSVPLDLEAFRRHTAALPGSLSPERAGDWFLRCACMEGLREAELAFDERYLASLEALMPALPLSASQVDELRQRLRALFFVGRSGRESKLGSFRGSGPLGAWVRAVATRQALNLLRASRPAPAVGQDPTPPTDPERRLLARELHTALRHAVRDVAPSIPEQELNALRLHLSGVRLEQIAEVYSAHRATVARWIQRAREALAPAVREALLQRLALSPASLDSLLGALSGKVELDLANALEES